MVDPLPTVPTAGNGPTVILWGLSCSRSLFARSVTVYLGDDKHRVRIAGRRKIFVHIFRVIHLRGAPSLASVHMMAAVLDLASCRDSVHEILRVPVRFNVDINTMNLLEGGAVHYTQSSVQKSTKSRKTFRCPREDSNFRLLGANPQRDDLTTNRQGQLLNYVGFAACILPPSKVHDPVK